MKTLGPQSAKLLAGIHDRGLDVFTVSDACDILEVPPSIASNLIGAAVKRGVVTRLRRGYFILVPYEMGSETLYVGNPYIIGHRLLGNHPHFISHGSAMELHGMTTQPCLVVYVTTQARPRQFDQHGLDIRFVSCKAEEFFGVTEAWVDQQHKVPVSDIERTVIDGLREPAYVGGYAEIDKGAWMKRENINPTKLVGYALQLGVGSVIRRVGFLMESIGIGEPEHFDALRKELTNTYSLLDPVLPKDGPYLSKWKLQVNVSTDELVGSRGT